MSEEDYGYDEGLEALESADWIVSKIGGLNACDFQGNFDRINQKIAEGKKQVVVLSVPRTREFNTTTHLNLLAGRLLVKGVGYQNHALSILEGINLNLTSIIKNNVESEYQSDLLEILGVAIAKLNTYIENGDALEVKRHGKDWQVQLAGKQETITGWGEDLVEELYKKYFDLKRGKKVGAVNVDRQEIYQNPALLRERYHTEIAGVLELEQDLIITGGYEAHLGRTRGFSDPKAALITESLSHHGANVAMVVEKQQPILTADPNIIPEATVIRVMSSMFASEVFGIFGAEAGALHPMVLPILNGSNAKVVVMNPAKPELGSTCIYSGAIMLPTTVVSRKTVPAIYVYGPMGYEKGVAEKVFHKLRKHNVDLIYGSENDMRVTLSASGEIESIEEVEFSSSDIGAGYTHKIHSKDVVMCISTSDEIQRGTSTLKDNKIKVESASFVGEVGDDPNVHVISFVMDQKHSTAAVEHLHNAFAYAA